MEFSEYASLLILGGTLIGSSIVGGFILTYIHHPEAGRAVLYSIRHPKEFRRLRDLQESPESINPDDFPYANKWGIIVEKPYRKILL